MKFTVHLIYAPDSWCDTQETEQKIEDVTSENLETTVERMYQTDDFKRFPARHFVAIYPQDEEKRA